MSFEDLEKKLRRFFAHQAVPPINLATKHQTHQAVLATYKNQFNKTTSQKKLAFFWYNSRIKWASLAGMFLVSLGISSFLGETSIAGQIEPKFGQVALIRDGKTQFITQKTNLKVGDIVQIADESRARITLPDKLVSTVRAGSEMRVMDKDKLYLAHGSAESVLTSDGQISTVRGLIQTDDQARVEVSVSLTGKTTVGLKEHSAQVTDWLDGQQMLYAGEEINLNSDTNRLANLTIPDFSLSSAQIETINAKLAIARTKFFTGAEKYAINPGAGRMDFLSAQKSFRSIAQVLKMDRHLNILKRINEDYLTNAEVVSRLMAKSDNKSLLAEAQAMEVLFDRYQTSNFDLTLPRGESTFFTRYVLLDQIFQGATPTEQVHAEILKDRYVTTLLRKIIDPELKLDQVTIMSTEIAKIPSQNSKAIMFLHELNNYLDPYLSDILLEKIITLQAV